MSLLKIILAGDSRVGKTSICAKYVDDIQIFTHIPTIGVDLKTKNILNVYDMGGLERFEKIISSYYRGCYGAVLVYDIHNYMSFCNLEKYYNKIIQYQPDCKIVLVANKTDKYRSLTKHEGELYALSRNMKYIEYNHNMDNIDEIFKYFYEEDITEKTSLLSTPVIKKCYCNIL